MYTYHVRELLELSEDEIWALSPEEGIMLEFDDKVSGEYDVVSTQISWYFWQITKHHNQVPITSDLHIGDLAFTDKLAQKIMNIAIQSTRKFPEIDREDVWHISYRYIYNHLYNALASRLMAHISSTDAPALLELMDDPEIAKANAEVTEAAHTVDHAYNVITKVFKEHKYPDNPVSLAVSYSTIKMTQMLPSVGPRGRLTDIDSVIYRKHVKRGFAMGFTSIADFAKESRSAAKALLFNKDPVATAEYFNRKLQFVAAYVKEIEPGDCGTTEYHTLHLSNDEEGEALLESLDGLTKVNEDGTQHPIDANDHSQLGKDISFRTTLTCRHLIEQKVCEKCYGELSYSVPHDSNPGHVSCTSVNEKITQLIISTKHLDFIIHSFIATINKSEENWLAVNEAQPDMIYLSRKQKNKDIAIRIYKQDATKLTDINYISDVENMKGAINRITSLSGIEFHQLDSNGALFDGVEIEMVRRSTKASLSVDMLSYIKTVGWRECDTFYTIPLKDWDIRKPMFVYPHKHENMSEFGNRVERFIRSSRTAGEKNVRKRGKVTMLTQYSDVDNAMYDAYYLISRKISGVYMGHIATILAASRVNNEETRDYRMPLSKHSGTFSTHDDIIKHRSLSVAMLYQGQRAYFDDIDSYIIKDRPSSILDDMIYLPEDKYPTE